MYKGKMDVSAEFQESKKECDLTSLHSQSTEQPAETLNEESNLLHKEKEHLSEYTPEEQTSANKGQMNTTLHEKSSGVNTSVECDKPSKDDDSAEGIVQSDLNLDVNISSILEKSSQVGENETERLVDANKTTDGDDLEGDNATSQALSIHQDNHDLEYLKEELKDQLRESLRNELEQEPKEDLFASTAIGPSTHYEIVSTSRGIKIPGFTRGKKSEKKDGDESNNGIIGNILKLERKTSLYPKNFAKNFQSLVDPNKSSENNGNEGSVQNNANNTEMEQSLEDRERKKSFQLPGLKRIKRKSPKRTKIEKNVSFENEQNNYEEIGYEVEISTEPSKVCRFFGNKPKSIVSQVEWNAASSKDTVERDILDSEIEISYTEEPINQTEILIERNKVRRRFFGSKSKPTNLQTENNALPFEELAIKDVVHSESEICSSEETLSETAISMESNKALCRIFGSKIKSAASQVENNTLLPEEITEKGIIDTESKTNFPEEVLKETGISVESNEGSDESLGNKSSHIASEVENDAFLSEQIANQDPVEPESEVNSSEEIVNETGITIESNKVRRRFFGNKSKPTASQVENSISLSEGDTGKNLQMRLSRGIRLPSVGQQNERTPVKETVFEKLQNMRHMIDGQQNDRIPAKEIVIEKIQNIKRRIDGQQIDRTAAKEIVVDKIQTIRRRINRGKVKEDKNKEDDSTVQDKESEWDWIDPLGGEVEDDVGSSILNNVTNRLEENTTSEPVNVGNNSTKKDSIFRPQSIKEKGISSETVHTGNTSTTKESIFWPQYVKEKGVRVKPYHRFGPSKVYMTKDEIYENMLLPSHKVKHLQSFVEPWFKARNQDPTDIEQLHWGGGRDGRIGSLRIEVLRCVGLTKQRPDISVYLVCGDAAFATDMINGSRSPIWPVCSKRAACFPIFHAYAKMSIGVFDIKKKSENDIFCGRTTIDIASLRPDTEYDITLPLRTSMFVYDRKPRGVIRIRFGLHWFCERAAVLSYLKTPRIAASISPLEQPSILCADPKTFRNVALTVHGQQLPGKYSREAFRATMREFNLYQVNIVFLLKSALRAAVSYEKPLMSFYIFVAWMHCVLKSSVQLVPVYFIGFLIFLMIESYFWYGINRASNLGFSRLSLQELLLTLLKTNKSRQMCTLHREKETKTDCAYTNDSSEVIHHREFPFSNGGTYKKFNMEEAVYRKNGSTKRDKKEETQSQGMPFFSLRYNAQDEAIGNFDSIDGECEMESDIEAEIMGDEDNVCGLHTDENLDANGDTCCNSQYSMAWTATLSQRNAVKDGPSQNNDDKPRQQIPPQVHLARLEENLNNSTFSISMDKFLALTLAYRPGSADNGQYKSVVANLAEKRKGKRIPLDEFDKRLGYRVRHPNPLSEITTSFMGPLMRIFRIFCIVIRTIFNIGVWTDPYLSFWVLLLLILSMLVLMIFPWRFFFFIVGLVGFGPQNIIVVPLLKRRANEKPTENANTDVTNSLEFSNMKTPNEPDLNSLQIDKKGKLRRLQNSLVTLKEIRQKRILDRNESRETRDLNHSSSESSIDNDSKEASHTNKRRRAFSATIFGSRKNMEPREVVVPYSRVRMERFFDWPPDPTVAQATPIQFDDYQRDRVSSITSLDDESLIYAKDESDNSQTS